MTKWTLSLCRIGNMSKWVFCPYHELKLIHVLVRLEPHKQATKRIARHGFLAYQALVSRRIVGIICFVIHHTDSIGHSAPYLRQSILLSAYETAETRSLYNNSLKNVEGKIRTEKPWPPIEVPAGIDQVSVDSAEDAIQVFKLTRSLLS